MARFIIDIQTLENQPLDNNIEEILLDVIAEHYIENKISVSCIDITNENQFYNEQDIANGFSNELSWKQIRKYKRKCNK